MAKGMDGKASDEELEEGLDADGDEDVDEDVDLEEEVAPKPAPRAPPARTRRSRRPEVEVSPLAAFMTSFILLTLLIAPVTGIVLYFMRSAESIISVFNTAEGTFMGGFAIGILAALVAAVIFTYRAASHT